MKPEEQLNLLGVHLFCKLVRKRKIDLRYADLRYADLHGANLRRADLRSADLRYADLHGANLRHANLLHADLRSADLRSADLDFSSGIPLWCGSSNIKIDEKLAKQILAHAFQIAMEYWPAKLSQTEINWLNTFHRINYGEFPKFRR